MLRRAHIRYGARFGPDMNRESRASMRRWPTLLLTALTLAGVALFAAPVALAGTTSAASVKNTSAEEHAPAPLIPLPVTVEPGAGAFTLSAKTAVVALGNAETERIARYFADLTSRTTGIALHVTAVTPPAEASNGTTAASAPRAPSTPRSPSPPRGAIAFTTDANAPAGEGYSLSISATAVTVRAREPRGLFYGAITLWQLATANTPASQPADKEASNQASKPFAATISIPSTHIEDSPRFAWRGLMLDVARHFMPPEGVKQLLDQMALHKLNTFHWHLTDDQGWRIQIKKYPLLTDVGAWRVPAGAAPASDIDPRTGKPRLYGGYYTQDEVREIVRYASERFITVVPEIEMPGHAQAAIAAYPQLGTEGPRPPVSSDWGVHNYLYNVDESTFSFLEDVLTEVMALFPGPYIHTGGDEAAKDRWRSSSRVQQRMRELGVANEAALQGYFTHRIEKFLSARGRKLIGWDEILEGGVPASAAVMSWRGEAGAIEAAKGGHDVVMAPSPALYLDYLQSDAPDEPPGRPRHVTLEDMYLFDVVPAAVTGDAARRVIGAQINAWTEHMRTPERMQHAIFPRIAAFAENVWSGENRRDWRGFVERLPAQFARYEKLGVRYADSAYAVRIASGRDTSAAGSRVFHLTNQLNAGEIRYTLDGSEPTLQSPVYTGFLEVRTPVTITAATFQRKRRMSVPRTRVVDRAELLHRNSDELKSCSNKLPLRLEDDAPRDGARAAPGANVRAVFNVDILDPCWIYERADLSRVTGISASVGQVPFNFQVGEDAKKISLHAPQSAEGELEVRLDSCEGERIAVLPLAVPGSAPRTPGASAQTAASNGVMALPPAKITPRAGAHDLCLRFTRRAIDPIWVIDSVQLVE
jgi:hexosaminidase